MDKQDDSILQGDQGSYNIAVIKVHLAREKKLIMSPFWPMGIKDIFMSFLSPLSISKRILSFTFLDLPLKNTKITLSLLLITALQTFKISRLLYTNLREEDQLNNP